MRFHLPTHLFRRALAVFSLAVVAPVTTFAGQQLHGHIPAALAALRPVERLPAAQRLHLAIGLPLRNPDALKTLIAEIHDPASPNYRQYLTPAQFTERFGPTQEDYQVAMAFAQANGLTVTMTHPNRLILDVEGAITDIEKTFHVTLRNYPHPREGRTFYAPDVEPSLDLAVPVLHISGLDNYSIPKPNHKIKPVGATGKVTPNAGSAPGGAYAGNDFRAAYVPGTPLTGAGQSVGLLQFDGYYASDIATYKTQFGLPDVPIINVAVDGGVSVPGTGNGEVCLDIEMVLSMAPGVSAIYVYMAPNPSPWVDLLSRMANDNLSKQLSCSWGGGGVNPSAEAIFQQMAVQGQSFFNATGDSDAFTSAISFPSDSPNITQVGATTLTTSGAGGAYVSEKVWNWGLVSGSYVGSSGGTSTYYPIPSWQQTTSMSTNQGSTTKRNVPDVALTGDNVYVTYHNGTTAATGAFGGTSCAAPLWAAFTALVNQQAAANGRASVGFLNAALYALGNGTSYTSTFHDTTTGNNFSANSPSKFSAVAGYDLCTGWGTPNGTALINALAGTPEYLQISVPAFAAAGRVGGPFTPTAVSCTLTNSGTAPLNWTAAKTQPWTMLSATTGSLAPGANTTVTWSVTSDANLLSAGSYADTATFINTSSGSSQNFGMTLTSLGPPGNLAATPGNNTAKLTWSAAGGATGYNMKRSLTSGGPYATVGTSTGTSYMDSTVTNGTTYYYVVSATNGAMESDNSGEASVIPAALPSSISLASSLGTAANYGTTVTFTATVTGTGGTATGSVTFKDGTTVLGTATLNGSGVASVNASALAMGAHALTASYAGDATYAGGNSGSLGFTVNPKPVTLTGVAAANKVYDATAAATLTGGTVSGLVGSDIVTVVAGSGAFASANAGSQPVTATGYAIGGANAGNYVLSAQPTVANTTITPRPIQVTGTRDYDGTTVAAADSMSVSNNLDGANLTLTGSTNLTSRNAGVRAIAAGAALVRVQSATGNTGSSAQTSINVNLVSTPVSGNTLIAVISTRGTSANRVTGITQTGTVTWSRASQATNTSGTTTEIWYAPNVSGAGKVVTITQASLRSAAVVIEYSGILDASPLDQTANATGNSTAPVTGTTAATAQANELWIGGMGYISSSPALGSLLNGFSLVASAQSTRTQASFNAKVYALERLVNPVGAASSGGTLSASAQWSGVLATFRTEVPSTLATTGSASGNYTVAGISGSVSITPKPLTVTAVSATKTYDGTTTASGTPTLSPSLVSGDTPGVLSQAFQSSGAGTGNKVIIPSLGINDGNGGANYAVTPVNCTTGTILPAAAGLVLGNLSPTYDGSPKPVTVTPTPSGLAVAVTYDGSSTVPSAAGSYAVVATVADPNYTGSTAGTLSIKKAAAIINLTGLTQTYDGTSKTVTATPTPGGLSVAVTYNGSTIAPTAAGSYVLAATVTDPNYTGAATGTLVIGKATATIGFAGLAQTYDGSAKPVTTITTPADLPVDITYNGSTTVPSAAGSYVIAATVTDPDHTGSAAGTLVIDKAVATIELTGLTQTYDGSPKPVTAAPAPAGLPVEITYNGSTIAPSAAGSYVIAATVTDPNHTGGTSGTLIIEKAAATLDLTGLTQTYDGSPKPVTVTPTPAGLAVDITYAGSTTAPSAAGSYAIVATVNDANYKGSATATLVVDKATLALMGLSQTYDGAPKPVSAPTLPAGLAVDFTYDGSATAPTHAGSYAVVAAINDPNYHATATGTLVIEKAAATIELTGLAQTYDGSPKPVTATPAGLAMEITYNGSTTAPSAAGSYVIAATVTDPEHTGSAAGTLVIDKAVATIELTGLTQTYDGSPKPVTVMPAGLAVDITYVGPASAPVITANFASSASAPSAAGSYAVVATVTDPNHTGSASGTLTIEKAPATIDLTGLFQTYDGSPKPVIASPTPAGLTVLLTYNGSANAPSVAGSYAVVATVSDPNYTGSTNATLKIDKAAATLDLTGLTQTYDGSPKPITVTPTPAGLAVDITYDDTATVPSAAGSYAVVVTVNDPNHTGSASGALTIEKAAATIDLTDLAQTYDGSPKPVIATPTPAGLAVEITYDGATTAPSAAGSYAIVASVSDANHTGTATATLVVDKATLTLTGLIQTYDGAPKPVTAPTMPAGLAVDITYAGSSTAPSAAGGYAITAFINDPNYHATATGTLVINKAVAAIGLTGLVQTYDGTPKPITTTPTGLAVDITYAGTPTPPTLAGSYEIAVASNDPNYQGSATGTLVIVPAKDWVSWSNEYFSATEQSAGLADAVADADHDGLTNLAEYALGTDPRQMTRPMVAMHDTNGFSIIFTRPLDLPGVTYAAESSGTLGSWSPALLEVLDRGPATETVRARDPLLSGDTSRRFLRLRFERR